MSQNVFTLEFKDKGTLYAYYMPFIKNGGLFIPTTGDYRLGDKVFVELNLLEETDKIPVSGYVVWKTPRGAQNNRTAGIGIRFHASDGGTVRNKIEGYLAGLLGLDRDTQTM